MLNKLKSRIGAWILGALFAILTIELVLLAPKMLDHVDADDLAENAVQETPRNESAAQVMVGINVVETRDERKDWELWADRAVSVYGEGDLELENVKVRFFGTDGVDFLVTGERGVVEAETKNMEVQGEVIMKSSNGYTFNTDNLVYDSEHRLLGSNSPVKVLGPRLPERVKRLRINGMGMAVDLLSESMKIRSDVTASRGVPKKASQQLDISSGSAMLSSKNQAISFNDDVKMTIEGVSISGPSAKFVYSSDGGRLKAVEMRGGVKVSDWNKFATAENVSVDLDKNRYIFKGRPRVVQDTDELFGDEIIFLDGGKRVKVKNARVKVSRERLEEAN